MVRWGAILSICLLVWSPSSLAATVEAPAGAVSLKVVVAPHISNGPFYIALEEGHFKEQGIAVEVITTDRSSVALTSLIRGDVDILVGTGSFNLLNAMARGASIRYVAEKGYYAPGQCGAGGLLVRKEVLAGWTGTGIGFLRGRKVAFPPTTSSGYFTEKALNESDLTVDDIRATDIVDSAVALDALIKGSIDAWMSLEPWITRALQSKSIALVLRIEEILPNFSPSFIIYGPNLLDKDPGPGRKFMVGYLKGVRQYNQGKTDRNVEVLGKYSGLDRDLVRKACWQACKESGQINVQGVLDFQSWGLKKGLLDKAVPVEQFWDPSFVDYAVKALAAQPK